MYFVWRKAGRTFLRLKTNAWCRLRVAVSACELLQASPLHFLPCLILPSQRRRYDLTASDELARELLTCQIWDRLWQADIQFGDFLWSDPARILCCYDTRHC